MIHFPNDHMAKIGSGKRQELELLQECTGSYAALFRDALTDSEMGTGTAGTGIGAHVRCQRRRCS